MNTPSFNTVLLVDNAPNEVFNAINNVRRWWSENISGQPDQLYEVFDYHYEDVHRCKLKIIEFIPGKKVVWYVLDNYFKFTKDETEWKDTTIIFDIEPKGDKTQLRMTHQGLTSEHECYDICRDSWTNYIQKSFRNLVPTGTRNPNGKSKPQTENEKTLSRGH